MNKCPSCDGKGRCGGAFTSSFECLDCHGTGNADFDPFARCGECFGVAAAYPPYKCERGCDSKRDGPPAKQA
jgi:hypothetical protein